MATGDQALYLENACLTIELEYFAKTFCMKGTISVVYTSVSTWTQGSELLQSFVT